MAAEPLVARAQAQAVKERSGPGDENVHILFIPDIMYWGVGVVGVTGILLLNFGLNP